MPTKTEKTADDLLCLILILPVSLFCAYVGKSLWWWFVVPLGAPAIGMAQAYGIDVLVSLWTMRLPPTEDAENIGLRTVKKMGGVALMLLAGWICHKLMGR